MLMAQIEIGICCTLPKSMGKYADTVETLPMVCKQARTNGDKLPIAREHKQENVVFDSSNDEFSFGTYCDVFSGKDKNEMPYMEK